QIAVGINALLLAAAGYKKGNNQGGDNEGDEVKGEFHGFLIHKREAGLCHRPTAS
ncbi:MAG: hypothetical protein RLZZ298_3493, partial [Pseudomonadota bacterium]